MIKSWIQSVHDIAKEIEGLKIRIQKTNLLEEVSIEIRDGERVTKTIAAWIHRRKSLAALEAKSWASLTNKGLQAAPYKRKGEEEVKVANVRRYYNQKDRDLKVEEYTSEPARIDAALEVANATRDLLE